MIELSVGLCDACKEKKELPVRLGQFLYCSPECKQKHTAFVQACFASQIDRREECHVCGDLVPKKKMVMYARTARYPKACICSIQCNEAFRLAYSIH